MMRGPFFILLLALCASSSYTASASASEFVPQNYRSADGALVLQTNGDYVEPYFAAKALITAQDAGLDIHEAGLSWIRWALQRQRKDGRFDRYRQKNGEWKPSGPADADDSMLALWLQLLYRLSPDSGIPPEWQESVRKAQSQLDKLRNGRLGIYHVSGRNHVALFMDNMEVYAALKDIALAQARFGDQKLSQSTGKKARDLAAAIDHVFWDKDHKWFRSSIQKVQPAFYPDVVAQVYPLLADFPLKDENARSAWSKWRAKFASAWLKDLYDPHPWGLVALAAMKTGDKNSALCWLARSESLRYSSHWNILEEAVFQGLEAQLQADRRVNSVACSKNLNQGPEAPGAP
ncbi:MAG TPA: hypothetical protein VHA33_14200 [Candidatus Angelobacter sp.]|jgi:hypothetical protein|nr:hypothetical protein [Candidatus Angelobacter sp.]